MSVETFYQYSKSLLQDKIKLEIEIPTYLFLTADLKNRILLQKSNYVFGFLEQTL